MAVLKAIVSSFKMREEKNAEGERVLRMKELRLSQGRCTTTRGGKSKPRTGEADCRERRASPVEVCLGRYNPEEPTDDVVYSGCCSGLGRPARAATGVRSEAAQELRRGSAFPRRYQPARPHRYARRGLLGKWGPNHAADPIVTRYVASSS